MGPRLEKLIRVKAPYCIRLTDIKNYRGMKVALELRMQSYKFIIAIKGSNNGNDLRTSDGRMASHIYGFWHKMMNMLKKGIHPVVVPEGEPPGMKSMTLLKRKNTKTKAQTALRSGTYGTQADKVKLMKRAFYLDEKYEKDVEKMLELMGIPCVPSVGEAEAQCAVLNISKKVDAVATEDWDALPFGTLIMLKDFSNKKQIKEIDLGRLLIELELEHEEFIELCVLIGTDYLRGIKGINAIHIYELYKQYRSIPKFLAYVRGVNQKLFMEGKGQRYDIADDFDEKWEAAKLEYMEPTVVRPDSELVDLTWKEPKYDQLIQFLCDKFELNREETLKKVDMLRKYYHDYVVHGIVLGEYDTEIPKKNHTFTHFKKHKKIQSPLIQSQKPQPKCYQNSFSFGKARRGAKVYQTGRNYVRSS